MRFFSSLVLVVLENHGFRDTINLPSHQYLANKGALLTNYKSVAHPSGSNYRALVSGNTWGPREEIQAAKRTLAHQLKPLGVPTFVANYFGMPAARHQPFADMQAPHSVLEGDFDWSKLPDECVLYLGMNDMNNAHSGSLGTADLNLLTILHTLSNEPWFNRPYDGKYPALFVVWDEDLNRPDENAVYAAWFGRGVQPGAKSHDPYDHYSFCRTVADNWETPPLENARTAAPMTGFWR